MLTGGKKVGDRSNMEKTQKRVSVTVSKHKGASRLAFKEGHSSGEEDEAPM